MRRRSWGRVHSMWRRMRWWWQWCPVLRRNRTGGVRARDDLQVRRIWRRFRRGSAAKRFHLHHHKLLPPQSFVADSASPLALVWRHHFSPMGLQCFRTSEHVRRHVAAGAEGLLLHDGRQGLRDNRIASHPSHSASDAFPDSAADATAHATTDSASHAWWTSRSVQLRSRSREHMEAGQEGMVLPDSPSGLPPDGTAASPNCPASSAAATADPAPSAADCASETR